MWDGVPFPGCIRFYGCLLKFLGVGECFSPGSSTRRAGTYGGSSGRLEAQAASVVLAAAEITFNFDRRVLLKAGAASEKALHFGLG